MNADKNYKLQETHLKRVNTGGGGGGDSSLLFEQTLLSVYHQHPIMSNVRVNFILKDPDVKQS